MSFNESMAAAIGAVNATGLPICSTMTFDSAGRSMMGTSPGDFANVTVAQRANFVGANRGICPCELMRSAQGILVQVDNVPLFAKGNCVVPASVDGAILYHLTPELITHMICFHATLEQKLSVDVVALVRYM